MTSSGSEWMASRARGMLVYLCFPSIGGGGEGIDLPL